MRGNLSSAVRSCVFAKETGSRSPSRRFGPSNPTPDPLGLCRAYSESGFGSESVVMFPLQRLGVSPDGSAVVFEVETTSLPSSGRSRYRRRRTGSSSFGRMARSHRVDWAPRAGTRASASPTRSCWMTRPGQHLHAVPSDRLQPQRATDRFSRTSGRDRTGPMPCADRRARSRGRPAKAHAADAAFLRHVARNIPGWVTTLRHLLSEVHR